MIYHWNIQQKTDEWHELRKLKMTGMNAQAIGNYGKGLETYCRDIVCGAIVKKESYVSEDMKRGNELEPIARKKYEMELDCIVNQIGFVSYSDFVGVFCCSICCSFFSKKFKILSILLSFIPVSKFRTLLPVINCPGFNVIFLPLNMNSLCL